MWDRTKSDGHSCGWDAAWPQDTVTLGSPLPAQPPAPPSALTPARRAPPRPAQSLRTGCPLLFQVSASRPRPRRSLLCPLNSADSPR